jgi:hypothetical protein
MGLVQDLLHASLAVSDVSLSQNQVSIGLTVMGHCDTQVRA